MYAYLKGIVSTLADGVVVLENNGIGYELFCSSGCCSSLTQGQEAMLYTYLHVREDAMILYGFTSLSEKNMFLRLVSVSGVGAKVAMSILSSASVTALASAVTQGDTKQLSSIKGIGKKTAERIVLELKDIFVKEFGTQAVAVASINSQQEVAFSDESSDAVLALMGLGYSRIEAQTAVKKVKADGLTVEQIILQALKN